MKSMIRMLLLGGACGLAISGAASAADLGAIPLRGAVGMWSGLYAGVNGGYSWNENDAIVFSSSVGIRPNPNGSVFGGQVGYNWQWTPDWVFGVETDLDWADIKGGVKTPGFVAVEEINNLGTARLRAGYVLEGVLLYATAGLAYGRAEVDTSITNLFAGRTCAPAGFCGAVNSKQWMLGWAAGVGFDWSFLPRWSFRTEYLHYDLGSISQTLTDPGLPNFSFTSSTNFRGDIVRGAINYKFW